MIILVNPRATRPANRRFPLSVMAIGASIPENENWTIVDGNRPDIDVLSCISDHISALGGTADAVRAIAFTVMPGPQLANAVPLTKEVKRRHPGIPIVWGGNFGSLYPEPVLNAPYVDWLVRGQGEYTFRELLEVLRGDRDPETVAGLSYRKPDGTHHTGTERLWVGPDELPPPAYDRIPVQDYLRPTFLGRRSGVYQASIGCPHACNFCGVISVFGRRQKVQSPVRTAGHLGFLAREHGMDSVHFYDNNFFLNDVHAREVADCFSPLDLRWWCEARVDAVLRFSEETWRRLKRAGLTMIFFGAESGSDDVLRKMKKGISTEQILEAAARTREHGIVPEFSFVFGDPDEPEREIDNTLAFVRRLKTVNPAMELIAYFYTPTPQRRDTYGNVDPLAGTPATLEEWTTPKWLNWMTHEDPELPWLDRRLKSRVEDFELVLKARFPSIHDRHTRGWGKAAGWWLARSRWRAGRYDHPRLLRSVRRWARKEPDDRQAYGHLRPEGVGA
ncbi:MAG TPA: radical SAM protein [Rhizomicrobium sp.]|nr:radical SAM protein [Rhizomicrobium sp.]